MRTYLPANEWVRRGGRDIADRVARSYDLEGMDVGTVAAGRIGLAVLRRLAPFDVRPHYTDRHTGRPRTLSRNSGSSGTRPPTRWCRTATW
ncbi:MAG TPA: NAD(P)-dependent oxidoreductase [Pseudonocardiaceae bacterium]|nr:NAD(P)-dependent oxidoreductase [Pseudonocardiaceae bacterium]